MTDVRLALKQRGLVTATVRCGRMNEICLLTHRGREDSLSSSVGAEIREEDRKRVHKTICIRWADLEWTKKQPDSAISSQRGFR